jgi:DNA-binding CsgD family transcriptional regulator
LAVALCGVVVAYGHLPPIGVFHVDHVDELLGLLLFIVNGVLVAGMASLMRERVVRRRRPEGMPASVPRRNAGRAATVVMSEVGLPLGDVPVESLTEREVEVLELVAAGMSNDEIAGALFLSVNTVKTHLKNVYGKLGVASRTQAVARAQELGIIGIGVLVRADPKSRARPPERRAGPPCPARRRVGPRSSHRRARHRRARDVGPTRRCARARR